MTLKFGSATTPTVIYIAFVWITLLIWSGEANNEDQFRVVHTRYGDIRGKQNVTLFNEKVYYSYRGIPYGKAPVNELRFKVGIYNCLIYLHSTHIYDIPI